MGRGNPSDEIDVYGAIGGKAIAAYGRAGVLYYVAVCVLFVVAVVVEPFVGFSFARSDSDIALFSVVGFCSGLAAVVSGCCVSVRIVRNTPGVARAESTVLVLLSVLVAIVLIPIVGIVSLFLSVLLLWVVLRFEGVLPPVGGELLVNGVLSAGFVASSGIAAWMMPRATQHLVRSLYGREVRAGASLVANRETATDSLEAVAAHADAGEIGNATAAFETAYEAIVAGYEAARAAGVEVSVVDPAFEATVEDLSRAEANVRRAAIDTARGQLTDDDYDGAKRTLEAVLRVRDRVGGTAEGWEGAYDLLATVERRRADEAVETARTELARSLEGARTSLTVARDALDGAREAALTATGSAPETDRRRRRVRSLLRTLEVFEPGDIGDGVDARSAADRPLEALEEAVTEAVEARIRELDRRIADRCSAAADARDDGEFERCLAQLERAEAVATDRQRLLDEYDGDVTSAIDQSDLESRIRRAERKLAAAERDDAIDERRASVADALDLDDLPSVQYSDDELGTYDDLLEVLDHLDYLEAEYGSFSYAPLRAEIRETVETATALSTAPVDRYRELVEGVETVLAFLETVDTSHPSVAAAEWNAEVAAALEERSPAPLADTVAKIDRMKSGIWRRDHLYDCSWREFERVIGSLYASMGYETRVTQGTKDLGVDVWATKNETCVAIQVKQFSRENKVGRIPLQQIVSTIVKGDADRAVVVTSGEFAATATEYAADLGPALECIDGDELVTLLTESDVPLPDGSRRPTT